MYIYCIIPNKLVKVMLLESLLNVDIIQSIHLLRYNRQRCPEIDPTTIIVFLFDMIDY